MSSLERHRNQVNFIISRAFVQLADGSLAGHFTCRSVMKSTVVYDGCIGELLCTCPLASKDFICKHLEAAVQQAPFTHAQRAEAANGLQGHLSALDIEGGVLQCRQVQRDVTSLAKLI
jgi:hypothetical protein